MSQVLAGLDEDYTPIVVQINSRDSISWHELQSTLMTYESRLEHLNAVKNNMVLVNLSQVSANFVHKSNTNFGGRNSNSMGRSRGRRSRQIGEKGPCQICGMNNHSIERCFNRYDERYMGTKPNRQYQNNRLGPAVVVTLPSIVVDPAWYVDSGASNHVTAVKENLIEAREYNGKESLAVGNGNELQISHVGTKHLKTLNHKSLILSNTLLVPSIKKNLVTVSQLTSDKSVFMKFHSDSCAIKDKQTQKLLL